jgi:hypothetical protein
MMTFKNVSYSAQLRTCKCVDRKLSELFDRNWIIVKRISELKDALSQLEENVIVKTAIEQLNATIGEFCVDDRVP